MDYDDSDEDFEDMNLLLPVQVRRFRSTLVSVCSFVIVAEFCERLAFYGLASSVVLFMKRELDFENAHADGQYSLWIAACYLTPLLGGFLADQHLGRCKTVLLFMLLYLGGTVLATLAAMPSASSPGMFFAGLYLTALGTGGIKPNVATLGADQISEAGLGSAAEKRSYFNWLYWSINLGSLAAFSVVPWLCQDGVESLGGEEWGFFVGWSVVSAAVLVGTVVLVSGMPRFIKLQPEGSVLSRFCAIVAEAVRSRAERAKGRHWLDGARTQFGGSHRDGDVNAAACVTRLVPFLGLFVFFWLVFLQMLTSFQNQGCQMDLRLGGWELPVTSLGVLDSVVLLVLIPLLDRVVFPRLKARGVEPTMLQRIGAGFFFAMLAMLAAMLVEMHRVDRAPGQEGAYPVGKDHISGCADLSDYTPSQYVHYYATGKAADEPSNCRMADVPGCPFVIEGSLALSCVECDDIPQFADMSVLWQIPQYVLMATGEILAVVTGLEFFYSQAPKSMRSVLASLNLVTQGLGALVAVPLMVAVNSDSSNQWVPEDVNQGCLTCFFGVLALLMLVVFFVYVRQARRYEYKSLVGLEDEFDLDDVAYLTSSPVLSLQQASRSESIA